MPDAAGEPPVIITNKGKCPTKYDVKERQVRKCDICGTEMRSTFAKLGSQIFRCPNCKLYMLDEAVSFDKPDALDESRRKSALQTTRDKEFSILFDELRKFVPTNASLLDVGCSYGDFLKKAAEEQLLGNGSGSLVGIEPEAAVAEEAVGCGLKVMTGFFPEILSSGERFDIIVFNNSFEHIPDIGKLTKGCLEHIAKNGLLVITVPLSTGILFRIAKVFLLFGRKPEMRRLFQLDFKSPHVYYYNKNNLTQMLRRCNFELVSYKKLADIDTATMKDRIMMDKNAKMAGIKALAFKIAYPVIRRLSEDKGLFIFRFRDDT